MVLVRTAAAGTFILVTMVICPASNGRDRTAATGIGSLVMLLLVIAISISSAGLETTDVLVQTNTTVMGN